MSETLPESLVRLAALSAELGYGSALIGGVAIIARVRPRATEDVDVLMAYRRDELDELLATVERHGYGYDAADRELFEAGLSLTIANASRGSTPATLPSESVSSSALLGSSALAGSGSCHSLLCFKIPVALTASVRARVGRVPRSVNSSCRLGVASYVCTGASVTTTPAIAGLCYAR